MRRSRWGDGEGNKEERARKRGMTEQRKKEAGGEEGGREPVEKKRCIPF